MGRCSKNLHVIYLLTYSLLLISLFTIPCYAEINGKEKVVGVAGFKVALPCNITSPAPNDELLLILWYRGDTSNPLYTMDARQSVTNHSRHTSADTLYGRAYFSVVDRPAVLILEPVSAGDAGTYKCRVDFRIARTRYSKAELSVIVPPKKPVITDVNGNVLESLIGPYNEGESLTLFCESEGGEPPSSVTWWRDSNLVDESFQIISHSVVQNIMVIPELKRNHLMNTFICQATNNNQSQPASTSVTINMNFKPLGVWIDNSNRPLSAEKPSKLVCHGTGSRPIAQLSWWIAGKKLESAKKRSSFDTNDIGNKTTSVLIIKPSIDDNGKYLSCRAENPLIPGSAVESGWKLDVHYIPQLSLRLGSKLRHSHIQEGNDVYLDCTIHANPPSSEIVWKFEGSELSANSSLGIIISNQSLVLQKVKQRNRGHYTCLASNSEGRGESNTLFLRVQYKPQCKIRQRLLYGTARNELVKVSCEVDSDPASVKFHWQFNNSGHVVDITDYNSEKSKSVAFYTPRTQYDYGSLQCWATNSAGVQDIPCVFSIIPAGIPDPPQNCTVINKTESSIRVKCLEGFNGGLEQHFMIEVHDKYLQAVLVNVTAKRPIFIVDGLSPGKTYAAEISSVNSKGKSQAIVLELDTLHVLETETLTHKGTQWKVNVSPVLIILTGVTGGLILVIIIIFLTLRYRTTHGQHSKEGNLKSNKYDKAQKHFASFSSQKCPDIIPGDNQLADSSTYEDMKDDYDTHVEDLWSQKERKKSDNFSLREFETQVSPCHSSPLATEEHSLLSKEIAWPPGGKQRIVESLSRPVCTGPFCEIDQTELSHLTRQTDV